MPAEILTWSNADIEFPSTSNSDEIDIHNHDNSLSAQLADIKVTEVEIKLSLSDDTANVENASLSKFSFECVDDLSKSKQLLSEKNCKSRQRRNCHYNMIIYQ